MRRAVLTAHVVTSVGWLGAVGVFLALAIAGLTARDEGDVRAVYVAMQIAGWTVLVPLAIASFVTGVTQSLTTKWGLFRHYWVIVKLALTIVATAVLVMYTETLGALADVARNEATVEAVRNPSPVLHAGFGLGLLAIATVLGIYKPRGLTPYGWRKQRQARTGPR